MAKVLPCVGRTDPVDRGIQSIWFLKTAVCVQGAVRHCNEGMATRSYQISVLFGAHPNLAIAPLAEFSKFAHFWMIVLLVIFDR